jgi:transposase
MDFSHTVTDWLMIYRAEGKDGLLWKGKQGRPKKLDDEHLEELKNILIKGPSAFGYEIGLWTLPRIVKVIEQEFGVSYHEAHVWEMLQSIGWSCQKPTERALERDEAKITEWKQKKWPPIKKAHKEERTIVFIDESGLSEPPTVMRTWAPRGETPVLQYHFNWKQLSAIAGVSW